jgi:hypothetical protein
VPFRTSNWSSTLVAAGEVVFAGLSRRQRTPRFRQFALQGDAALARNHSR